MRQLGGECRKNFSITSRTYIMILFVYMAITLWSVMSTFRDANHVEKPSISRTDLHFRGHGAEAIDMLLSNECKSPKRMSTASKGRKVYFSRVLGIAYVPIFKCNHVNIKLMMGGEVLDKLGISERNLSRGISSGKRQVVVK